MEVTLHMLKRYGEVMLRLEELGARAGKLKNSDRNELQSLLEEQAWLGTTMVKKAKSILEEIDGSFEKLFDWMIDISDLIDHAASEAGTPEDLLELEDIMVDMVGLKDQMKQLNLDKRITRAVTKQAGIYC
jgi:gamma-glutamyl:cysteine ligase YbdK (ATP-grasp superfamily)